jgi:hypothetical protein
VSADTSPPLGALVALSQAGIPFCVVGVTGINFYASDASQVVRTEDVDVLLAPRVEALRGALEALGSAGFSFRAGGEPFVDVSDDAVLWRVLERGGTITAEDAAGARLDLMLSARGLSFDDRGCRRDGTGTGGRHCRRRHRQVRDTGPHRRALAPRRVRVARHGRGVRWQ